MAQLDFWFDFASTYSYLTAMRIEEEAARAGVAVRWRPFLLGPIFARQGWPTSPFNLYPAKGRYMWRDMERLCAERGLTFTRPATFPQNGLLAARLALVGMEAGWGVAFARAVFRAEFAEGQTISDRDVLAGCLEAAGVAPPAQLARIEASDVKERLRMQTAQAEAAGVFGAPSFVVGDELFWGDDRLAQALRWATGTTAGADAGKDQARWPASSQ